MARTALSRPDAPASLVTPHPAAVPPITTRSDDHVFVLRVEDVVVDLARAESPDFGTVVDLAQPDARYSEAPRLPTAGHSPPIGAAFGTADLIDRAVPDALGHDLDGELHRVPHRRTPRFLLYGSTRLGIGDGGRTAYARKESTMYIGAGTLVVILIVVVVVMLLRGR